MGTLYDRIEHDFQYHMPTTESIDSLQILRVNARNLAHIIDAHVPDSREKSTALTKLEEVVMWANAGIARNQDYHGDA